eukprot:4865719-Pyramimonas_sp.AAC.1
MFHLLWPLEPFLDPGAPWKTSGGRPVQVELARMIFERTSTYMSRTSSKGGRCCRASGRCRAGQARP